MNRIVAVSHSDQKLVMLRKIHGICERCESKKHRSDGVAKPALWEGLSVYKIKSHTDKDEKYRL